MEAVHIMQVWAYIPAYKLAICCPPKCGTRSLLKTLASNFYRDQDYDDLPPAEWKSKTDHYIYMERGRFPESTNKVAVIRDPVDRFTSLWSHHCRDGAPGVLRHLDGDASMHGLIDFIEKHVDENAHWNRQVALIGKHKNIRYCKLEYISQVWDDLTPDDAVPFCRTNVTNNPQRDVPPDILKRLHKLYETDFRLFEGLLC